MQAILEDFSDILCHPSKLPPIQEIDHFITLKEGTEPVNVWPYNSNWELHLEHVRKTFEILRQHQFYIKVSKCAFRQQELEYLGHIVTNHGVKVDQDKVK